MTRKTFALSALVAGLVLLHAARVTAQLTSYDNFERLRLGALRWVAFTNLTQSLEIVRQIQEGKLALELTTYGQRATNTGTQEGFNGLAVAQAEAVRQLSAEVTMASYTLVACAANPSSPLAALEVGGHFFNDGSSTAVQDQTGDIHVRLALEAQEQADSGTISGAIARCNSRTCRRSTILVHRLFDLRWQNGQPVTVLVSWRPPNNDFVLRAIQGTQTEIKVLNYSLFGFPEPEPRAGNPVKFLRVRNRVANCTTGLGVGVISATVDDVQTNDLTPAAAAE
jgi:hypothetical protein